MKKYSFFLLRGLVRERADWGKFENFIKEKFPGASIHYLDLPGSGIHYKKACPTSINEFLNIMRKDYLACNSADEDNKIILAMSLGGMVATEWMQQHKSDFDGAVLFSTSFSQYSPFYQRLRPEQYLGIIRTGLSPIHRVKENGILKRSSNDKSKHKEVLKEWLKIRKKRPVSVLNSIRQILAAINFKAYDHPPIKNILLLCGKKDKMVSYKCSKTISKMWSVPLKIHPTGGHDLNIDDPHWVVDQLENWLSEYF